MMMFTTQTTTTTTDLLDYFAGQVLIGYLSHPEFSHHRHFDTDLEHENDDDMLYYIAIECYRLADKMLTVKSEIKELNKEEKEEDEDEEEN